MSWQVQEAKQRFSEVLRAVEREGPQTISRHGQDVAVIIEIAQYRHLTGAGKNFKELLAAFPKMTSEDGAPDVFDVIQAERAGYRARDLDLDDA